MDGDRHQEAGSDNLPAVGGRTARPNRRDPRSSDIAIPRGSQPATIHYAPITWHRFAPDTFGIGRTEHLLPGGLAIGLYSPERTIIDLFRLRHAWGSDLAIGSLKRWLRGHGNSPGELLALAQDFPTARPAMQNALEVLL